MTETRFTRYLTWYQEAQNWKTRYQEQNQELGLDSWSDQEVGLRKTLLVKNKKLLVHGKKLLVPNKKLPVPKNKLVGKKRSQQSGLDRKGT